MLKTFGSISVSVSSKKINLKKVDIDQAQNVTKHNFSRSRTILLRLFDVSAGLHIIYENPNRYHLILDEGNSTKKVNAKVSS